MALKDRAVGAGPAGPAWDDYLYITFIILTIVPLFVCIVDALIRTVQHL